MCSFSLKLSGETFLAPINIYRVTLEMRAESHLVGLRIAYVNFVPNRECVDKFSCNFLI
jgi:hypothetical protein